MSDPRGAVTRLLLAWADGDETALEQLMPLVASELRRIAGRSLDRERSGHTLQPTALVNEVYLRLVNRRRVNWRNRAHFFGFAAQTMRRILVDYARQRLAGKRGAGAEVLPLDELRDADQLRDDQLVCLDDALSDLGRIHPRQSRVVELHFFAGLNYAEIAEVLAVSPETVKRDFRAARIWLHEQMRPHPPGSGTTEEGDDDTG